MSLRKKLLAPLSLLPIILWGAFVFLFAVKTGNVQEVLKGDELYSFTKYNIAACILLFHGTWWIGTTGQILMAFAISDEHGEGYVHMLLTKYRIPLALVVVDIAYAIFFVVKFWKVL